jgi:putative acetyltransferase
MRLAIEQAMRPTAEIIEMLTELDAAMSGPYAADQRHALSVEQLFQPDVRFFVVRLDGAAVACGGIAFCHGYAELKRMYSRPVVRGRGAAKLLLRRLETEARAVGATLLRLETGVYQHEALRFYEAAGFQRREPFGHYADMPPHAIETSLFYEKAI